MMLTEVNLLLWNCLLKNKNAVIGFIAVSAVCRISADVWRFNVFHNEARNETIYSACVSRLYYLPDNQPKLVFIFLSRVDRQAELT